MPKLTVKVYLNDPKGGRRIVEALLLKRNKKTLLCELPDGNIIKRVIRRDLV